MPISSASRPRTFSSLGLLLVLLSTVAAPAADARAEPMPGRGVLRSAAVIVARGATSTSEATACLVDRERRLLLTSLHAVEGVSSLDVLFPDATRGLPAPDPATSVTDAWRVAGKIVARDGPRDLALIEVAAVPRTAVALQLARADRRPGKPLYLVGNLDAAELRWGHASGMVMKVSPRHLTDPQRGRTIEARVLEARLDAPPRPGYSGGPVVDAEGCLVGLVAMLSAADPAVVWCIDAADLADFLEKARGRGRE